MTYLNEYRAARARGESIEDARYSAKEARQDYDNEQYEIRLKARQTKLRGQAAHLRKLIDDGKLTEYQSERAILRAENLEARARGERVPHNRLRPDGDITRPSRVVKKDAKELRKELAGKSPEEAARIVQQHLQQRITPGTIQLITGKGVESTAENWARAEVTALQSMIDRKSLNPNPIELSGGARRANYDDGIIKSAVSNSAISRQIKAATPEQLATTSELVPLTRAGEVGWRRNFAHEFGHHLEENPNIYRATSAFLRRRTVGERDRLLSKIDPHHKYGPSEFSRPDRFIHPYTGKIYPWNVKATEVLSMGLEYMRVNPVEFARRDPDHFDFIYKILRGDL